MANNIRQRGFSPVEIILVVVVVAVLAGIGWMYWQNRQANNQSSETTQQDSVPAINNAADLEASEHYLRNTDVDGQLNTGEIDSALSQ